ncbi:MAG TPA: beta-ketoacyl reductase, partial [Euzebya sp.]|nr:beta-ketoacyl reductase [Euzebya sp.]
REVIAALDVPLRGIVHAAGGLADGMLHTIDRTRFQAPLGAKVIGSALLADLARDAHVDLFVLYSSAVALLGGGGQANHIVACAFQDQLAHQLRGQGVPAVSLNWGAWSAVGAAADPDVLARMAARGLGALTPEDGTAALDLVLQDPPAQVAVIPVDWASVVARPGSEALHPLLQPLVAAEREATSSGAATGRDDALLQALARMTPEEVQGALVGYVLSTLGRVLGRSLAAEDATRPLHELGLDSLIAIDLRNRMLVEVEVDVAIERLVGGGTPADVAGDLAQTLLLTAPGTDEDSEGYEELTL